MRFASGFLVVWLLVAGLGPSQGQERPETAAAVSNSPSPEVGRAAAKAVEDYWTPERMACARPMPTPTRVARTPSTAERQRDACHRR